MGILIPLQNSMQDNVLMFLRKSVFQVGFAKKCHYSTKSKFNVPVFTCFQNAFQSPLVVQISYEVCYSGFYPGNSL